MTTLTTQGTEMPRVGLGTWPLTGEACREAVRHALEIGYRHVDTARMYENERDVGRGLADSGVAREEVFVTTKIWPADHAPDRLRAAAEDSLRALGLDRIDLLLLHWPSREVALEDSLGALVRLRDEGLIGLLGVSNFPAGMLRRACSLAPVACDQVEFHPFLGQDALLEAADELGVAVTAYSPLAQGAVGDDPVLREIASRHGRTPGQVALRWLLDHPGTAVIPKSGDPRRRAENLDLDFALTDDDRARIDALPKDRRDVESSFSPDWSA